jgi:hypothetical protein
VRGLVVLVAVCGAAGLVAGTSTAETSAAAGTVGPGAKVIFPIFWTWQDRQIEDPELLRRELLDIKQAGFGGVYCMLRATRYNLLDREVTEAARRAGELCRENGLEFVWGADPRFAATPIIQATGHAAEMLMVNRTFQVPLRLAAGADASVQAPNEVRLEQGRYSLRYPIPARRDLHMSTEVSLSLNPVGVDRVFAYQKRDGQVVRSSVRDVTQGHHLFVNRAFGYVEVFGRVDLPPGEWFVFAFPRFRSNVYAYDSPEHERQLMTLVESYKAQGLQLDGFWWDEPGYYFQYGHFAISERIYDGFRAKYGYDLAPQLLALMLEQDDASHLRVRHDYFQLLMDYVFGAERRLWEKGEALFGPLRMGIHHTWHWLPDDASTGTGDLWRGLTAVDGGYTDQGSFERYFEMGERERFIEAGRMVVAKSLARFSRDKRAHFNQWGVKYTNEVPVYWNDLMAAFSNEWINHCYGYTGVLGADRSFGPGFPDHESWSLSPGLNARNREVLRLTGYALPVAEVAIVYPTSTVLTGSAPQTNAIVEETHRLIGIMPALGIQADAVSEDLLASGRLVNGALEIQGQRYKALVVPYGRVVTPGSLGILTAMKRERFPLHLIAETPFWTTRGERVEASFGPVVRLPAEAGAYAAAVERLSLPSPCTRLPGAYLNVLPGAAAGEALLTVMPVDPRTPVAGEVRCLTKRVRVERTDKLAIYRIGRWGVRRVF